MVRGLLPSWRACATCCRITDNSESERPPLRWTIAAIVQRNGGRSDALLSVMRQQLAQAHHEGGNPRAMPPQGGVGSSMPPRER